MWSSQFTGTLAVLFLNPRRYTCIWVCTAKTVMDTRLEDPWCGGAQLLEKLCLRVGVHTHTHTFSPFPCPGVPRAVLGTAVAVVSGLTELTGETDG